jgi:thymidylate synthase
MKKSVDELYLELLKAIKIQGTVKKNRTGVMTTSISGYKFEYDMSEGFPILTTKKMAWKTLRVELEGFIRGITDKRWFQERGCKIWNEWCNPTKVPYGHDPETQAAMLAEPDLGPIYGYQWRNFNGKYEGQSGEDATNGIDQLAWAINQLKTNPDNRRIIVSAWNPCQLDEMALVPCHYSFQLVANDGDLDLIWNQRSVDTVLGLPFNIASYGLLLSLIADECGMIPNKLIGNLGDVHIYHNHREQVDLQLERTPYPAPELVLGEYDTLFDWTWDKATLDSYVSHEAIKADIAI